MPLTKVPASMADADVASQAELDAVAATMTFNGEVGGRKFGGVMVSSITITEIKA